MVHTLVSKAQRPKDFFSNSTYKQFLKSYNYIQLSLKVFHV